MSAPSAIRTLRYQYAVPTVTIQLEQCCERRKSRHTMRCAVLPYTDWQFLRPAILSGRAGEYLERGRGKIVNVSAAGRRACCTAPDLHLAHN